MKGQAIGGLERALADHDCSCSACTAGRAVVDAHHAEIRAEVAARSFDLRREFDRWAEGAPDESWSTPSLVMATRLGILSPPWIEGLKRAVATTQALALLGERGLQPDAHVRCYLARTLCRRVITQACDAFVHARDTGRPWSSYPYQVADWFPELDDLGMSKASFDELTAAALSGPPIARAETWVASAAMAHVVEWRCFDYLNVSVDPRDEVLPGGVGATMWVFDRFSHTSTTHWRRGSAELELCFARDADGVADFVGVARGVLDERPTSLLMALDAQVRRTLGVGNDEESARGLFVPELVEQILAALRKGDLEAALSEARQAHALAPTAFATVNALAFCTLVKEPQQALALLAGAVPSSREDNVLLAANRVTALVATRELEAAFQALQTVPSCESAMFLWDVDGLLNGEPRVHFGPVDDWVARTRQHLRPETDS